jgi:ligand-binding sensor domain-containing protein
MATELIAAGSVLGQAPSIGTWESHTSLAGVRSVVGVGVDAVAASGNGGVFIHHPSSGRIDAATNVDGLASNDLTAVGEDGLGGLWVGSTDGALNHRPAGASSWRTIADIRESNRLLKGIQRFVPKGDTLFIVSEFGVSVYRVSRREFGDTYASFGYTTPPVCRDAAVVGDTLWVANDQGLAAAWLGSSNLSAPTQWRRFSTIDGLPAGLCRTLAAIGDTLVVGTSTGAAARTGGAFVALPSIGSVAAVRFRAQGGVLYSLTSESGSLVVSRMPHVLSARTTVGPPVVGAVDLAVDGQSVVWVGISDGGIAHYSDGLWRSVLPDAPGTNRFVDLAVEPDGTLWAGTGINGGGRGIMRFRRGFSAGRRWTTFTVATAPALAFNDYHKVSPAPDGTLWAGSWGWGVVQIRGDSVLRRLDTRSIPALSPTEPVNPDFVVVGDVASDAEGTMWIVNRTAVDGNVLVRLMNDSTVVKYRNLTGTGEGRFTALAIDRNGTKWLANSEPSVQAASGLYYFNESISLPGSVGSTGWGVITQSEGLANNVVQSIVVDLEGDVWAGTALGVTIFNEPSNPRTRRSTSFPLREQSIQAIAVDGVNNKWVGTREGAFVVSPDGSQLLAQYTVANTGGRLVSNDVRSIAIDQNAGIVYLGTESGLSALSIPTVQTERQFTTLLLGPNPFPVPSETPLTIRRLMPQSRVKILSISGALVTEFDAQGGGRAFWDGRDRSGSYVGSGTYVIVAFNENGEQITTAKVAVVRR